MKLILVGIMLFTLSGCLKTRSEVKDIENRQVIQQQVTHLQKNTADVSSRFMEIEENIRILNGRTEVLENRLSVAGQAKDQETKSLAEQNAELQRRVSLLQESMVKMESQLMQLSAEVGGRRAESAAASAQQAAKQAQKSAFDMAEEFFSQKEWRKAILNYEKYRQEKPKGKYVPDATYKIGVAFQELKMRDEARTFYEEVIAKYPKSVEARRAKTRLKGLPK